MNKEIAKIVGSNVRLLRKKKEMTQDQLAAKLQVNGCDITRNSVTMIEMGKRFLYPDEIILIKEILKVEYEDILDVKKE